MSALTHDDIAYAMESTVIVQEPDRRIDTFGTTNFEFHLLTEPMDAVGCVRVREGRMVTNRPMILRPGGYDDLQIEGFGEQARAFAEWFRSFGNLKFLHYGFHFAKQNITECVVHEPLLAVQDRIVEANRSSGNPSRAVIVGIDDGWEISLLKFSMEMIAKSVEINLFDWQRRGML
jgi:hypothetical protein